MKFFMLSKCGEGAGLLYRIQEEGNQCCIKILEKDYSDVYEGLLERSNYPDSDAVVIVDSSDMGKEADELKRKGFKVFGGSSFADKLELDRNFGFEFMEKHGIEYPTIKEFKKFPEGIKYAQERNAKLVFKPSGNLPCKLTYCASSSEEMINYLKFVEEYYSKEIEDFILQDFIEGKVVSTEFWVGSKGFIRPANHTVEVKKFMNDNLGPSTGCQGNLVWAADEEDEIISKLLNIEETLVSEGYLGPIDLNAIINEKNIFGLEWTPRFGLDAMPSFIQLVDDVGKLIFDICDGTIHDMNGLSAEFSGGVRLSIPPYPAEPKSARGLEREVPSVGVPVDELCDYAEKCYFYEIKCVDGQLVHSLGTGVIAVVSDIGDSPQECFFSPEDILEDVKIPDKQYRTDLSKVLPEMYCDVIEILEQGIE